MDDEAADVRGLGRAGMARYRAAPAAALDLPAIDPIQAAATTTSGAGPTGS